MVVFIKAILIYSKKKQENEEHLRIILQVLREQQRFDKFRKCDFFKDKIQCLGHVASKDGIAVDPKYIKAIIEWSVPKNIMDIRSFLGIMGCYWKFVKGFSKIAYPITSLHKKGNKFNWSEKCTESLLN